ncbi:MAG: DVU_1551 family NTP transferase [Bacillota bacterium]|jgi:molybdenum cofactor cytidylyltransferase
MKEKIAGLIVAAGLSSRMEDFKPLLPVDGKPMLQNTIENMRSGGAQRIVVVLGKRASELVPLCASWGAETIINERYFCTDMFTSVKLGLNKLGGCADAVFFTPGDVPLFRPHSLKVMTQVWRQSAEVLIKPAYQGRSGHPILFARTCIADILAYQGTKGLKDALGAYADREILLEIPDPGILLDADTPVEYQKLLAYATHREIPDRELCLKLCHFYRTPERTIRHGLAVAQKAQELAEELVFSGHNVNLRLVQAAAILHDLAKGHADHTHKGAEWLYDWGYDRVAEVVAAHTDVPDESVVRVDEKAIVYLADKYVKGEQRVSLEERFSGVLNKFKDDQAASRAILGRLAKAHKIQAAINKITGA